MIQITQAMKDCYNEQFKRGEKNPQVRWFSSQEEVDQYQLANCNPDSKSVQGWTRDGSPNLIWPVKDFVDSDGVHQIACFDAGYGKMFLWDGYKWHVDDKIIITPSTIFIGDYFGHPEGKLFRAI